MADVKYVITVDATGATKSVQTFDKAIEDLQNTAGNKAAPAFGRLWQQFAIGQIATGALRQGWRLLKDQVGDSIKAAIEAEKADKSLDAALDITGRKVANLSEHFKREADALMRVTVFDDEAIKGAQALLIQMTSLDRDGIDRATRGAIGLASVLGMDLHSATMLVQKAMEGNFTSLSRYGIKVDETLTLEEKRVQLLDKLDKMFGRATADTETFGGQLAQLKNRWGEVQEASGRWLTQQKGIIELLNKASSTLLDYLTMSDMVENATKNQVEQENNLAERLGRAAVAANWKYREMARLIEAYNGNFALLIRDINAEKYGTEIKEAYIATLRKEKAQWAENEAARRAAERGTHSLGESFRETTKLIETEIYAVGRLTRGLSNVGQTSLPPPKSLPDYQMEWLGLADAATNTESAWDAAMQSMTAGLVSFGDANATIWGNVGNIFGNFLKSYISGLESMVLKQIWAAKMGTAADKAKAQSGAVKWIMDTFPWPISLIVAAGSFALVNSLFSKILKFERGGYFDTATMLPAHMVGEAGPEYYLPESKLIAAVQKGVRGRGGDGTLAGAPGVSYAITINGPIFQTTAALTDGMIREKSRVFFDEMENQARIRGRRLTNG